MLRLQKLIQERLVKASFFKGLLVSLIVLIQTVFSPLVMAQEVSLRQMAGQMLLLGFQGDSTTDTKNLRDQIASGEIGGVMYLKTNVASLDAVKAMNAAFLNAGAAQPPLIALDQEGGSIERLTSAVGFDEIPSAEKVAASMNVAQARDLYGNMANGLSALGFNVNFGPVVDVNVNPNNPIIARYGRSFSSDPAKVADYAQAFIAGHRAAGVLTALKHYPGHGSSTGDSHNGFVDITKSWHEEELWPYKALSSVGAIDMVMVGHLYHANYSPSGVNLPSSLSPQWIDGVLRDKIGFDGVVVSDDMEMGAIRKLFSTKEAVIRAVQAGVDILLFSNTADYDLHLGARITDILVNEAEQDLAFKARIEQSYKRIVALKARLAAR